MNFLKEHLSSPPGDIIDPDGKVVGRHKGLAFYTIGQRKGLGFSSPTPLYVLAKQADTNTLVVGVESELGFPALSAGPLNWISGRPPRQPFAAQVKTRYTARAAEATVTPLEDGSRVWVDFASPVRDVSPGQAAVLYAGDTLLGGGPIQDFA